LALAMDRGDITAALDGMDGDGVGKTAAESWSPGSKDRRKAVIEDDEELERFPSK
jgi:hypothetical protein